MRSAPATSRVRIVLLGVAACLWLGLLLVRLVDLQVLRHAELARRAERQQQRTLEVTPKRGVIYDRNQRELAVSVGVDSVFAVPAEVSDRSRTARLLARALRLDRTEVEDRLRSARSFVWVKRKLDAAEAQRVRALELSGIYFEREHKRFYPKRELAAHVLGFVGLDEDGLGGLEYAFDGVLRGPPRRLVITADGRRRPYGRRGGASPEGASLVLTLDENIQYIAERELAAAIKRTRARGGSLIVQNPATGEILALANQPTFNPNHPTAVPTFYHVNRSVTLAYEPGSTFKVVTIAAVLEEGLARATEVVDCQQGGIVLAGHLIRDHKPFGRLTVREIVYRSSDVGAIKLGLRLGDRKMYKHIRRWHFGQPTGIEFPAESRGLLRPPGSWSRISIGAISMGQEIATTSLQLTAAFSAIANGGVWIQPRVVAEIVRVNQVETLPPPRQQRIISVGVAEELRRMLAGVVTRGGGLEAQPAGYSAAGKTGTAQKIDETGTYSKTDYVASFIGFAPVLEPAITVLVMLDSPRGESFYGGEVAAPVFRRVVEQVLAYLNVPRDLPLRPRSDRSRVERAVLRDFRPGQLQPALFVGTVEGPARFRASKGVVSSKGNFLRAPGVTAALVDPPLRAGSIVTRNGDSVEVPDFSGNSLRKVVEACTRLGLEPVLVGNGVAVAQQPAARTRLPRGSRVRVEFRASLPAAPARPM